MKKSGLVSLHSLAVVTSFILYACAGLPSASPIGPTAIDINTPTAILPSDQTATAIVALIYELATGTAIAALTPAPTLVEPATATPTATPIPAESPTATVTPTPPVGGGPAGCVLRGMYIADVTIPDGTVLDSNASFVKTWRIRNDGTCEWDAGYQLVYAEGAQMGGQAVVGIPSAAPGQVVDISINLVAPGAPGDYAGTWRLRASNGAIFGGYTVVIKVTATPTPIHTPTPTSSVGSIQGEIRDFRGPISGVKVEAWLASLEATTDSSGRYFFSSVPPGEELVAVKDVDHQTVFERVVVRAGQITTVNLVMTAPIIPGPCTRLAAVKGRVLLRGGQLVVGAIVWMPFSGPGTSHPATTSTDKNGWYQINNVCAGSQLILAEGRGMRAGVEVDLPQDQITTAPDIILFPR